MKFEGWSAPNTSNNSLCKKKNKQTNKETNSDPLILKNYTTHFVDGKNNITPPPPPIMLPLTPPPLPNRIVGLGCRSNKLTAL